MISALVYYSVLESIYGKPVDPFVTYERLIGNILFQTNYFNDGSPCQSKLDLRHNRQF